jgi:type 1 glutamine amidotransferase
MLRLFKRVKFHLTIPEASGKVVAQASQLPPLPSMKRLFSSVLVLSLAAASSLHSAEPKKVLVLSVTTGFRHSSIETGEKVLQRLADESKAFQIVDFARQPKVQIHKKPGAPRKPGALKPDADEPAKVRHAEEMRKYDEAQAKYEAALAKWTPADDAKVASSQAEFDAKMKAEMEKLSPANLAKYDGVIFVNTTGDLPLPDRDAFIKWVADGHALIGMHSASDTFHSYRPYIELLGGEFAGHGPQISVAVNKLDPAHPATAGLPDVWNIAQEEIYMFKNYDRSRVRDLLGLSVSPKDKSAGHFPVSWVREEGKGRVFFTSLGHREDVWDETSEVKDRKNPPEVAKAFQQHILGGIRWALGVADSPAR